MYTPTSPQRTTTNTVMDNFTYFLLDSIELYIIDSSLLITDV